MQLFPFACFRVVLDGGILVPDHATVQCGQRYNRQVAKVHVARWRKILQRNTQKVMLKNYFGL